MKNYLDLLEEIMTDGVVKDSRAGKTKAIFGKTLEFNVSSLVGFPILTTRKVALRISFEETMMFLRGETDTKTLEDKKVFIWQGNTTREFLDNRGLGYLPEGSLGTGYSHQWRNFGGDLGMPNGADQVADLFENIKADPDSRRHIISAWNPQQLSGTPLPPCHLYQQYVVNGKHLDSTFVMRSVDAYHGLPYNIMCYSMLNILFAKAWGYLPGKVVFYGVDVHIYESQFEVVKMQLKREPKHLPILAIPDVKTLDDILALRFEDFELIGYDSHPALPKVEMAV